MKILILAVMCISAFGQNGTVTVTPPIPPMPATAGSVIATAGTVACTITGNAVPATSLAITCTLGASVIAAYTVNYVSGTTYAVSHSLDGNQVTFTSQKVGNNPINWNAGASTAACNNAVACTATGSGTF